MTIHEFFGDATLYSILSHTWGSQEFSYQDILNPTKIVKAKSGYAKLLGFLEKSREMGYRYAWIDTCCIDKTSSSELTEAINSMYSWYRDSAICLIYLADVDIEWDDMDQVTLTEVEQHDYTWRKANDSRWFSRGWTLQELVAPRTTMFFTRDWRHLSIPNSVISQITSIPSHVLRSGITDDISVAQKMCWASKRHTTRVEDMAYCLLGLFDVNMPLLYGEGEKAFTRLQEEIIRRSGDHTIFLWKDPNFHLSAIRGILARHPSEFSHCAQMTRFDDLPIDTLPYSLTNTGLQMSLRIVPIIKALGNQPFVENLVQEQGENLYVPILHSKEFNHKIVKSVILKRMKKSGHRFARVLPDRVVSFDLKRIEKRDTFYTLQPRFKDYN